MTAEELFLSIEDANRRLPLVRAIVKDAMELKTDVLARQDRLLELRERHPEEGDESSPYSEEVLQMEESLEADEIRIDDYAQELQQVGANLVNAESGLVEFASDFEGRSVWLSWMYDEVEVGFWRSDDDEPANRKPLVAAGQNAG